jgi:hypothetical protein
VNPYRWPRRVAAPLMYLGLLVLLLAIMLDKTEGVGPILFTPVGGLGALVVVAVTALHFWLRRREERWQRREDRRLLGLDELPSEADEEVLGPPDEAERLRLNAELDPRVRSRTLMMFRVGMTITPILGGVLILALADSASHFIVGTFVIAGGLLAGALFWWEARRIRRDRL